MISFPSYENHTVYVPSYVPEDYIVTRVIAHDADINENALLSYQIVSGDDEGIFALDDSSGYLSMNIDYKVTHVHEMELGILVSDNGAPQLSTNAYLYIAFNETMNSTMEDSGETNKGENQRIANRNGIFLGILVVILLVT